MLLFAFLGYMPIIGLCAFLTMKAFNSTTLTTAFGAAFTWMGFYAVAVIRFQTFKCPRCGLWFFAKSWCHNMFAQKCLHCGLPKFADLITQQR